ncbi:MAG: hypothetical protein ABI646_08370, partial [Acidobacteriota bacterium]
DGVTKFLVFDIRTGRKLNHSDLFIPARLPDLLAKIRTVMKRGEEAALKKSEEMRSMLADFRAIDPEFHPLPEKIEFKDLQGFGISDTGVTFKYDYGYPHVAEALEPPGDFFIAYYDLKPLIRTDGLLARFVR